MNGECLFYAFLAASFASTVISARLYAAERRMAEGRATETELRRWMRHARRAWGRRERIE